MPFSGPLSSSPRSLLTIGIMGSSSSGKSTLAVLLSEIFSDLNFRENLGLSMHDLLASQTQYESNVRKYKDVDYGEILKAREVGGGEGKRGMVIHQDEFFKEKKDCPLVEWVSSEEDVGFLLELERQIQERGEPDSLYHIERLPVEPAFPCWKITGPDTDCLGAIKLDDFLGKIQATRNMLTSQHPPPSSSSTTTTSRHLSSPVAQTLSTYSSLIQAMQQRIKSWVTEQNILNAKSRFRGRYILSSVKKHGSEKLVSPWLFIEGFMLLPSLRPEEWLSSSSSRKD